MDTTAAIIMVCLPKLNAIDIFDGYLSTLIMYTAEKTSKELDNHSSH